MNNPATPQAPPDPPEIQRKKIFWKLAYARDAFAKCQDIVEYYTAQINDQAHPLYYSIICSLCVTYTRAFTHGQDVGTLPRRYFRIEDPKLRHTHQMLIRTRHQIYAHKDATVGPHHVGIRVTLEGNVLQYKAYSADLVVRGIVIPDILPLAVMQRERVAKEIMAMFPEMLPEDTALRILRANRSTQTNFPVEWRKTVRSIDVTEIVTGVDWFLG